MVAFWTTVYMCNTVHVHVQNIVHTFFFSFQDRYGDEEETERRTTIQERERGGGQVQVQVQFSTFKTKRKSSATRKRRARARHLRSFNFFQLID